MKGPSPEPPACAGKLPVLIATRKHFAYGEQDDYWDEANCVGWVRRGTHDKPYGCAVVLSNKGPGTKRMFIGSEHKGEVWTDVLGWEQSEVVIGDDGWTDFVCPSASCAVWVNKIAPQRDGLGAL